MCDKEEKEMEVVKKEDKNESRKNLILTLVEKASDKNDEALKKLSK